MHRALDLPSQNYKPPIIAIYNNVIQELLVQQHFMRYNIHYEYNAVSRTNLPIALWRAWRPIPVLDAFCIFFS